jgi:hypothetical protein
MSVIYFIRIFFVDMFYIQWFCKLLDLLNIKIDSIQVDLLYYLIGKHT